MFKPTEYQKRILVALTEQGGLSPVSELFGLLHPGAKTTVSKRGFDNALRILAENEKIFVEGSGIDRVIKLRWDNTPLTTGATDPRLSIPQRQHLDDIPAPLAPASETFIPEWLEHNRYDHIDVDVLMEIPEILAACVAVKNFADVFKVAPVQLSPGDLVQGLFIQGPQGVTTAVATPTESGKMTLKVFKPRAKTGPQMFPFYMLREDLQKAVDPDAR